MALIAAAAFADHAQDAFAAGDLDKWLRAANQKSKSWSREALLSPTLGQTKIETREQAIALLGLPNFSADGYDPGRGLTNRLDLYRLSAKDDVSFRLDYEPSGKIRDEAKESTPHFCPTCRDVANSSDPALPAQTVSSFLKALENPASSRPMLSDAEHSFGRSGLKKVNLDVMVGGRPWANYSVIWRVADAGHRFVMATGHLLMRDYSAANDLPIDSYDLVTVTDECLVH